MQFGSPTRRDALTLITQSKSFVTRTVLALVLAAAVGYGLWQVKSMIVVVLTAIVLAAFIEGLARPLMVKNIPRQFAVILMYVLVFGCIGAVFILFVPSLLNETIGLSSLLQSAGGAESLGDILGIASTEGDSIDPVEIFRNLKESFAGDSDFSAAASATLSGAVQVILVLVISFYVSMESHGVERFIRAVTPNEYEPRVVSLWKRTEYKIGQWFKGQLLQAFILALLTYVGLWILEVPYAVTLSLLAGVLGIIPFGIIFAGILAMIIAFTSGGTELLLMTTLLYIILQQFENYILQPLIINKVTGVPSVVVLIAIIMGSVLLGFAGLILAIPAAVIMMEIVSDYNQEKRFKKLKKQQLSQK